MFRKSLLLVVFLIFFPIFAVYAQEKNSAEDAAETEENASEAKIKKPEFWMGSGIGMAFYNTDGFTYDAHFTFGYGLGSSIGIKTSLFFGTQNINILELDLLVRFYFLGKDAYWGPFIQLIGGASLIDFNNAFEVPSSTGVINAGLGFGWSFLVNNNFFVEPNIRLGYPYYFALGVSAGVRF
jgi:hypothetical protein